MKSTIALVALVLGTVAVAQERALLPPPPPLRNPMLVPEKVVPAPPTLGAPVAVEAETPGWILRRSENGKWQVLWQGRWVGKNQMLGDEKIINIDEYGIQVRGANGKRNIPLVGTNLSRQQKENKQ